jgi:aspartate/methionine/tyrosine aminotransferase
VNPISEFLALHILKKKDQILPAIISRVKDNIKTFDLAFKELKSLEDYIEPLGGLVCFPKLKKGITSELYADELKKNCDIFVLPGINFEREGYIRVGFGESNEKFKNGLARWIEWEKKNERK